MSEIISLAGVIWSTEMGYVIAFVVFIVHDLRPARRHPGEAANEAGAPASGRRRWSSCSRWLPALPLGGR